MTTFRQFRGNRLVSRLKGEVGLEIETEAKEPWSAPMPTYWLLEADGSLRQNGVEFILKEPLDIGSTHYLSALDEFAKIASEKKFIKDSAYTSVHVHLNMLDFELVHLMNFISLYVICENFLTRYCGSDRDGNLFCLKTSDAESSYKNFCYMASDISQGNGEIFFSHLNENRFKYSGLNIVPLRNFGSVEVRTHRGTNDIVEIDRWVRILECLYRKAKTFRDPVQIVNLFNNRFDYTNNINYLFGEYVKYFDQNKIEDDIDKCLYYAAAIAASVKNWEHFGIGGLGKLSNFKTESVNFEGATSWGTDASTDRYNEWLYYNRSNFPGVAETYTLNEDM